MERMFDDLKDINVFVGIDIETTGLNHHRDLILELGVVILDMDLNPIESKSWVIHHDEKLLNSKLSDFTRTMHTANGLITEVEDSITSLLVADREASVLVSKYGQGPHIPFGSNIGFDMGFINEQMPGFACRFGFRRVDASGFALLLNKVEGFEHSRNSNHRVMEDIHNSVKLAKAGLRWKTKKVW
jgi:oligoribonuclease